MAHSVEFLFDDESERRLRERWELLRALDLPNAGTNPSATNRPHVTIAAAQRIAPAADTAIRHVDVRLPIRVAVGSPIVFGRGDRLVVALLVVPTAQLLAAHEAVLVALDVVDRIVAAPRNARDLPDEPVAMTGVTIREE